MKNIDATERAFKNGYEAGFKEGYAGGVDVGKRNALKWIPIVERFPTEIDGDPTGCVLAIEISDTFARRWEIEAIHRCPGYFTHWMPLPEPPKEG